jgi:hypothetical protein
MGSSTEKLSGLKAMSKSRSAGQGIDKKQYSMVISMNDAIDQNPYDTSPFRSALRPFIESRQQVRAWWRNIDKGRSISAAAFA